MFYFAYGSNMNPVQIRERCPGHRVIGIAQLPDHEIAFPLYSNRWNSGVASAQPRHGAVVWGVLYELTDEDVASLDRFEGFQGPGDQHNVYDREPVNVELTRPDDGSFPRRVRAHMYVARPSNASPPTREYLDVVLDGARHHALPPDYIEDLRAVEVSGPVE